MDGVRPRASRRNTFAAIGVVLLSTVVAAVALTRMPDRMAVHWNAAGRPVGFASPVSGLGRFPALAAALFSVGSSTYAARQVGSGAC